MVLADATQRVLEAIQTCVLNRRGFVNRRNEARKVAAVETAHGKIARHKRQGLAAIAAKLANNILVLNGDIVDASFVSQNGFFDMILRRRVARVLGGAPGRRGSLWDRAGLERIEH
jgi:hypothetical protein